MANLQEYMQVYRRQLEIGAVQQAYRGLMAYIMALRTHFEKSHPHYYVSSSIYYGYMDMTYFSIASEPLRELKLKIAVVFLHEAFRFEAWLAGNNRGIQSNYWELFKESGWKKYQIVDPGKGVDAILETTLAADPDFSNQAGLTGTIERKTLDFMRDIEEFLLEQHE